jgi:hypothetical protein
MRNARKLVLRKESLFELSTDELRGVAGGAITPACPTNPNCLSRIVNPCDTRTTQIVSQLIDPCTV